MRNLAFALIFGLALGQAGTAKAEEDRRGPLADDLDQVLRQMMKDLKPAWDEAVGMLRSFEAIDDPRHYQLPEILPNGDIIIRRRPDAPDYAPHPQQQAPAPSEDEGVRL